MDGLSHVQARIASIEQRFAPTVAPVQPSSLPSAPVGAPGGFDAVLDAVVAGTTRTSPVPGQRSTIVPQELTSFANGQVPRGVLREIGIGNHRLASAAADAFTAMRSAAAEEGIDIGVTDSYRSLDQQVDVARRKGLYSQGGLAAQPGTSNHGWGISVDVDVDDRGQQWLRVNGARFGFVEDVAREPWHWTYRPDSLATTSGRARSDPGAAHTAAGTSGADR